MKSKGFSCEKGFFFPCNRLNEANQWNVYTVAVWKGTFVSPSFTSSQSAVSTLTAALVWSDGLSLRNHKSSVVSETMAVSMSWWRRNERDHLELRVSAAGVPALQPQPVNTSPFFLTNSLLSPAQLLQSPLGEKGTDHYSQKKKPPLFLAAALCSFPLLAGHTAAGHHATVICNA